MQRPPPWPDHMRHEVAFSVRRRELCGCHVWMVSKLLSCNGWRCQAEENNCEEWTHLARVILELELNFDVSALKHSYRVADKLFYPVFCFTSLADYHGLPVEHLDMQCLINKRAGWENWLARKQRGLLPSARARSSGVHCDCMTSVRFDSLSTTLSTYDDAFKCPFEPNWHCKLLLPTLTPT